MPRQARIDSPGALHHIIIRGIEKKRIFRDDEDRYNFIDRLGKILTETSTSCYAWALIPNHAHLFLRTGTVPIATIMRRLLTGYAGTFNRRYSRHGQLFQNRYKSILCQEDIYFIELVRYIHLNPLRSKMVDNYSELNGYPYCGHGVILGKNKMEWQNTDYVLNYFAGYKPIARKKYKEYVEDGIKKGRRSDLIGGGLIRSIGGWAEAARLKEEESRLKGDERILGDSVYVMQVLNASQEEFERKYKLKTQGYDLDFLAKRVSDIFNIKPEEMFSPGKYRKTVKCRSVFCYWAVRELGETATSLAKIFGLSQPAVSVSVARGEKIVSNMNIKLLID